MFLSLTSFGYGDAQARNCEPELVKGYGIWLRQSDYAGKDDHGGVIVEIIWFSNSPDDYKIEKSIIRRIIYHTLRNCQSFKDSVNCLINNCPANYWVWLSTESLSAR